eukprot:jgi/Botrbrau1/2098/Bobra.0093s0006.1
MLAQPMANSPVVSVWSTGLDNVIGGLLSTAGNPVSPSLPAVKHPSMPNFQNSLRTGFISPSASLEASSCLHWPASNGAHSASPSLHNTLPMQSPPLPWGSPNLGHESVRSSFNKLSSPTLSPVLGLTSKEHWSIPTTTAQPSLGASPRPEWTLSWQLRPGPRQGKGVASVVDAPQSPGAPWLPEASSRPDDPAEGNSADLADGIQLLDVETAAEAPCSPSRNEGRLQALKRRQQEARRTRSANATLQRDPDAADLLGLVDGPGAAPGLPSLLTSPVRATTAGGWQLPVPRNRRQAVPAWPPPSPTVPSWATPPRQPGANWLSPVRGNALADGMDSSAGSTPTGRPPSFSRAWETSSGTSETAGEDPVELTPLPNPEEAFHALLTSLNAASLAKRRELDWQSQNEALLAARRLVLHHPHLVLQCLHTLVLAILPGLEALRSGTARSAMQLVQDMATAFGRSLDAEAEHIIPPLARRAGEVSTAGRDTFLASLATQTLTALVENLSEIRTVPQLVTLSSHKSMHTRTKVASQLDQCLQGSRGQRLAAGSPALLDKVFRTAVGFLEEGSLETRTYGKRMVLNICRFVGREEFRRLVCKIPGEVRQRKLWELAEGGNVSNAVPVVSRGSSRQSSLQVPGGTVLSWGTNGSVAEQGAQQSGQVACGVPAPPQSFGAKAPVRRELQYPTDGPVEVPPRGDAGKSRKATMTSVTVKGRRLSKDPPGGTGAEPKLERSRSCGPSRTSVEEEGAPASIDAVVGAALEFANSKDWLQQGQGLERIRQLAQQGCLAEVGYGCAGAVVERVAQLLAESNVKVGLKALEVVHDLIPYFAPNPGPFLSHILQGLSVCLASSSMALRERSEDVLAAVSATAEPCALMQTLCESLAQGLTRGRESLLNRITGLVDFVHPTKPGLILKCALPVALGAIGDRRGEVRAAGASLLAAIWRQGAHMQAPVLEQASRLPRIVRERVASLFNMARQ